MIILRFFIVPCCLVVVPARMNSLRLPKKPLADIAGKPMVVHVVARALAAGLGRTLVATDSKEIFDSVKSFGFEAIITHKNHLSGTDRIYEVVTKIDPNDNHFEIIVNVQGDLPTVNPKDIRNAVQVLSKSQADIVTICAEIIREEDKTDPNVVKLVGTFVGSKHLRALYFTRARVPYGDGPIYHHIGIYVYRRKALERFISLAPSTLERREQLEQLRALEYGMKIEAMIVSNIPQSVDTLEDLQMVRTFFKAYSDS